LPGRISKEIFVSVESVPKLPMHCRGGHHCCNKDHLNMCLEGEGDCNSDTDCAGVLKCGNNNCLSFHPAGGGQWDAEDDCCERKCTPQHPCNIGGGQCLTDADCINPGWAKCGLGKCLNTTYFPRDVFIYNTPTHGFHATDGCCYRVCNKNYHICGLNEIGCQDDNDCLQGLYCNINAAQPYCSDVDECDPTNGMIPGQLICGPNTQCFNSMGSFNCTCSPGYQNYIPWQGCVDINECASYLTNNCSLFSYTQCINTPGNYICVCQLGYQGDPAKGCYDIDECRDPNLNRCNGGLNASGFNSETFGGENIKFFPIQRSPDLFSLFVRFEVASPAGALMWLCLGQSNYSCYQLLIGGNGNTQFSLMKNNVTKAVVTHSVTSNLALSMFNFKTFWINITLQYPASLLLLAGSANDPSSINFTDSTKIISVGYIGLSSYVRGQTTFWRNVRVGFNLQVCINNFGGHVCVDIDEDEHLGIGTGGTMGTTYLGRPAVITRDMISCSSHTLSGLSNIVSHGMAALNNWLFVCGGQSSFSTVSVAVCMKIDMDNSSAIWISAPSLPNVRQDFGMVSFNQYIFAIGGRDYQPNWGYSFSKSTVYRYSLASNVWATQAILPKPIFDHCVVSDEPGGLIWSIGGTISQASPFISGDISDVYVYKVEANTWALHSQLNYTTAGAACGMVTLKSGWKWLVVALGDANPITVQYWSFFSNLMWRTLINSILANQISMRMLSLTPYSLVTLAGQTLKYGRSQRNFFALNINNMYFESGYNYLFSEMAMSAWIRVKRSYRSLANCISVIKYAAVGWGGQISSTPPVYTTSWDVLLRSRSTSMMWEPNSPVRCDNAIPDLSPGKITVGITSVGYWLLVCGGYQYLKVEESTCHYLDTNQVNPAWTVMPSMPRARGDFPFVTYGDTAFAIGGYSSGVYLNQMDRWTRTKGWVTVAPYPAVGLRMHCGVADEGYDKIYILGGIRCDLSNYCTVLSAAYQYTVSTDMWSTFPDSSLYYAASSIACAITRRSNSGNRVLLLTGNGVNYLQYFDLVSGTTWSLLGSLQYSWTRPKMVAVTPWEVYLVGGVCSGCPSSYG
jgi:hypothetical protein